MKQKLVVTFALAALLGTTACGGRKANIVKIDQVDDYEKSCMALKMETDLIKHEIKELVPEADKASENFALALGGAITVVPWLFMDFTHSEEKEIDAYRKRHMHLAVLAADKKCAEDIKPIPEYYKEVILDKRYRARISERRLAKEQRAKELADLRDNRRRLKKLRKIREKLEKQELASITTLDEVDQKIEDAENFENIMSKK